MTTGPKRPQAEAFFDELKQWSEIKLRILTKYLDTYLRFRLGSHRRIYYVDGFAGTGRYGQDEASGVGSPVRLAQLAQRVAARNDAHRLVCINTEAHRPNYEQLCRSLASFDPEIVKTRFGPFADHLPEILELTRGCPAVFFLDPLGVKPVTVDALRPVLQRADTEVLINLLTPRLFKLAGFEDSTSPDSRGKLRLVSAVLGEDPDQLQPEWLKAWHRIGDAVRWGDWAAHHYVSRLRAINPRLRYGFAYAVKETFRSSPKYYLIFLTRSEDAVLAMNDFICTEDKDLFTKTETMTPLGQSTFFGLLRENEEEARFNVLVEEMYAHGFGHQGCCRNDLVTQFVFEKFGEFKKKHHRQALERLLQCGRARRAMQAGPDTDPLTFL